MTGSPEAPTVRTERLSLRPWRLEDRAPFAALNADAEVMGHFPAVLSEAESDAFVDRIEAQFGRCGFGLWAVEVVDGPPFIGFVGLAVQTFDAPFTPAVEVGWRLARDAWGHGYATEAARAALAFAFDHVVRLGDDFRASARAGEGKGEPLGEVVSMTSLGNWRSQRVMESIGLTRDPADDFDHPNVGSRAPHLRRHVLYRTARPAP